jgi:Short C-terminal domain
MLGREKRHERKLEEHGGKTAWATVLDVQKWQSSGGMNVSPGAPNSLKIHCKLKLRVEPEGTPPFEAEAHHVFTQQAPWEGCSVAVIYDPSKPSDLVIDESQGFGRGGAGLAGFAGGDAPGGKWTDRMDALLAAQSGRPGGPQVPHNPPSEPVNVADQLTKLADLRDRGILSETEFQAQKARLLAE